MEAIKEAVGLNEGGKPFYTFLNPEHLTQVIVLIVLIVLIDASWCFTTSNG